MTDLISVSQQLRTRFLPTKFRPAFVKTLANTTSICSVFALIVRKFAPRKFFSLELMKFRIDFGAEDEARLTPCKDDKIKDAEITLFQAGAELSAKQCSVCKTGKEAYETDNKEPVCPYILCYNIKTKKCPFFIRLKEPKDT